MLLYICVGSLQGCVKSCLVLHNIHGHLRPAISHPLKREQTPDSHITVNKWESRLFAYNGVLPVLSVGVYSQHRDVMEWCPAY